MGFQADFAAGLEAIYAQFGDPAIWEGRPCTVIRAEAEEDLAFGRSRARTGTVMLHVRVSEVAVPAAGDQVTITPEEGAATLYRVLDGEPQLDPQGFEWTCEAEKFA